ncbi:MAG: HAD-IC family P-type ATPase, partial [Thermoguttaceae bacterium]|nr:HAD-IC family P-type ATPase [Thermoguttaceae bacterium]
MNENHNNCSGCGGDCACAAANGMIETNEPTAGRARVFFEGNAAKHRGVIAEMVRRLEPAAEIEWDGDALEITVPDEAAQRMPVVLRDLSFWLNENLPQLKRSYNSPAATDEDEDDDDGGNFFARYRSLFLAIGAILFAASIAAQRFLPDPAETGLCIAAFILTGGEIVWTAIKRLFGGAFLDERFLMTIASLGAFAIGEKAEAVAVMLFYQVGEAFQRRAVGRSRGAIAAMMNLRPDNVALLTDGALIAVAPEEVAVGESIVVSPGQRVPLDGVITDGETLLDTSALTGESMPRRAAAGDTVLSGSIVQTGRITLKVTHICGESTLARILNLVQHARSRKTPTELFITTFSRYYTPLVVAGALLLAAVPPLCGAGAWPDWIHRALVFLVVSCPCALVISVPLSYFGGIGAASR